MSALPFMDNIGTASFRRARTVATNQSPFNGQVYRSGMMDTRWQFRFDYQTMTRAQAQPLLAAIAAQGEGLGNIVVFDPDFGAAMSGIGSAVGACAAGQTGSTLATTGWPASRLIAKAGDRIAISFVGIAWRVFIVTADVASNGSGNATFALDAPMLSSPATGADVRFDFAVSSFGIRARIVSYETQSQPGGLFQISVSGEEVL